MKSISEQQLYEPRDGPLKKIWICRINEHIGLMKDTSDVLAVGQTNFLLVTLDQPFRFIKVPISRRF